jgi:uncharacterized protein YciI
MKYLFLLAFVFMISISSFAQDGFTMKSGDTTYVMKKYYMYLLKRGANTDMDSATHAKIMEGHLAHFANLMKQGKICIVGPFDDDQDIRGIIIFNVSSSDEAKKLESEDPAVKSGRLVMEIRPWWGAKGSMLK